jgi:hypothetical protein
VVGAAALKGGFISLAVDDAGTATAVWAEKKSFDGTRSYRVRAARRVADGRWTRPQTIGCRGSEACSRTWPRVGVDGRGRVTAVWTQGSSVVWVERPARGRWSRPRLIATEEHRVPFAELAVAQTGTAVVAWDLGDESLPVRATRRGAHGGWARPVGMGHGYYPVVAVSATGAAMVAHDNGAAGLSVRTFEPGQGWGRSHQLGRWPALLPELAFDEEGRALAVWAQELGEGGPFRVHGQEMGLDGRWSRTFDVSPPVPAGKWVDDFASDPVIASSGRQSVALLRSVEGDDQYTGLVMTRRTDGTWAVEASYPGVGGWGAILLVNGSDDLALAFDDRVSLRPSGQSWSTTPGGGTIGILPDGGAVRMWWDGLTLKAQEVSPPV